VFEIIVVKMFYKTQIKRFGFMTDKNKTILFPLKPQQELLVSVPKERRR
jgi:hypothetical protein